jgi:hypothetical protein
MIINIRGSHGSGKSTIVRTVLEKYPSFYREEIRTHIRKRPWGYVCQRPCDCVELPGDIVCLSTCASQQPKVFIPGHYETPCGGCDTISAVEDSYNRIKENAVAGRHVLFEGILAQHYALKKFLDLKKWPLKVVVLSTSLEDCIKSVQERRAASGKGPLERLDAIKKEYRQTELARRNLREAGVEVIDLHRGAALQFVLKELGWN